MRSSICKHPLGERQMCIFHCSLFHQNVRYVHQDLNEWFILLRTKLWIKKLLKVLPSILTSMSKNPPSATSNIKLILVPCFTLSKKHSSAWASTYKIIKIKFTVTHTQVKLQTLEKLPWQNMLTISVLIQEL